MAEAEGRPPLAGKLQGEIAARKHGPGGSEDEGRLLEGECRDERKPQGIMGNPPVRRRLAAHEDAGEHAAGRHQKEKAHREGGMGNGEGAGAEGSGSEAYVPPEAKDDKQLNYALDLLRGLQSNAAFPPDPNRGIPN